MKKDSFIKFSVFILLFNLLFVMPFQACAPLNNISEDDEGEQNLSSSSLGKTCADTEHLEYRTPILTKAEVSYIITDLFPTEVAANANILATVNALSEISVDRVTDKTVHPENNSGSLKSAVYLLSLIDIAQALFDQYSLGTSINTNCLNVPNSCLNYVTNNLVPRLWRRPLIDQEKAIFSNIFSGTQTLKEKLNSAFLIAFTSPQFFYKNYLPKSTGTILNYSQYSLASRISFFLYNSVPDALLWQDAQAGNLANPAVIDSHIDRLLTQEPYITRFTQHALTSWLRLDDDVDSTSTVKNAQGISVKIADLAKQQFLQVYQVVKENRNISQIFFSDSVYMNKSIAAYLNLNSSQYSTEFQKVNIIPGTLESSFIASPFFANATNSSTNKTLVTKRGIFITKNLLCGAIPVNELDPAVVGQVLGPNAPTMSQIEIGNIRRGHVSCKACHKDIDTVGMGVEYVDSFGNLRTKYSDGKSININLKMTYSTESQVATDLPSFLKAFSHDQRVHSCFIKVATSKVAPVEYVAPNGCADEVVRNNPNLGIRSYIKGIVKSKLFTQVSRGQL